MATSDANGILKLCQVEYHSKSRINTCAFSQRGLLAFSTGHNAIVWNISKNFTSCNENGKRELSFMEKHKYVEHLLPRKSVRVCIVSFFVLKQSKYKQQ